MTNQNTPKVGDLRVWHVPQVPCDAFYVSVASPIEAKLVMLTLAQYDLFQLEKSIKPDFCNAQGLEVYEADAGEGKPDWCEWYSEDGDDIDSCEFLEATGEQA